MNGTPVRYLFQATDRRYGLTVSSSEMDTMLRLCIEAGKRETGGVLIGHYSRDHEMAIVTRASGPPDDSQQGATFFIRGVKGLQRILNRLWMHREYYLGEWHFHPFAEPIPSAKDEQQMAAFARDEALKCPEPILLLIGGDPKASWRLRAIVYPRNENALELTVMSSEFETRRNKK